MTWTKHLSGPSIFYTSGEYRVERVTHSMVPDFKWTVRVEGKRVFSADTMTRCQQAAEMLANGIDPNKFYNWK